MAFSGELLAMVVIGGMRSFLGPALGALFFVIFRDYLSGISENWLLWFGLLFVGFILFSPTGLVGVAGRVLAPFRKTAVEAAAMAGRKIGDAPLPEFLKPASHLEGPVLKAEGMVKHFGGIKAVEGVTFSVRDRTLHALIGPNGAGKTTAFNLVSGMFPPDAGTIRLGADDISGLPPDRICRAGIGRSFQITNLFPTLPISENIRLAVQARHPRRFDLWTSARAIARDRGGDVGPDRISRTRRHRERGSRCPVLRRPAAGRHGAGAGHQAAPAAAR